MKKLTSLVLLVLLLYNMMGYFLVYLTQSYFDKHELYEGVSMTIPSETIVKFQIPLTYYPQPNREAEAAHGKFAYDGKYYELIQQRVHGDTLYLEAFEDITQKKLEQSLYEHVQDHVLEHQNGTAKTPLQKSKRILANLLKDYLPEKEILLDYPRVTFITNGEITPLVFYFSSRFLEITSPPPQAIC